MQDNYSLWIASRNLDLSAVEKLQVSA